MASTRAPYPHATRTGPAFQALRKQAGLTVRDLARLCACTETTLRNIESPALKQRPSRQLERMLEWLCDPLIRERVETLEAAKRGAAPSA